MGKKSENHYIEYCDDCYGEGSISDCCMDGVDDGRCMQCGKFAKTTVCANCEGAGHVDFYVGDMGGGGGGGG